MQSHYEINVSYRGRHLFATHERSTRYKLMASEIYKELAKRFPEAEGFKVTVTEWAAAGYPVDTTQGEWAND